MNPVFVQRLKQLGISSVVTFVATFAIVLYPMIDHFTLVSFGDGTLIALLATAIRAGFKVLIEGIILMYQSSKYATDQSNLPIPSDMTKTTQNQTANG